MLAVLLAVVAGESHSEAAPPEVLGNIAPHCRQKTFEEWVRGSRDGASRGDQ